MILRKKLKQLLLFVKHWHEILIIKDITLSIEKCTTKRIFNLIKFIRLNYINKVSKLFPIINYNVRRIRSSA